MSMTTRIEGLLSAEGKIRDYLRFSTLEDITKRTPMTQEEIEEKLGYPIKIV